MTNIPTPTAPTYSTIAGAISGVATWALSTYAFHGAVPAPVQVALYILIPAAVTGIASLLTKNHTNAVAMAKFAKQTITKLCISMVVRNRLWYRVSIPGVRLRWHLRHEAT